MIPVWRDDTVSPEPDNSPELNNSPEPNTTTTSTDEFKPLPPGWLYIYLNGHLWREVEVCNNVGVLRDVDLGAHAGQHQRPAKGQLFKLLLVPHKLNSVSQTVQLAYAQQQWTWTQLCNAGGINPEDPRFLPTHKQRSANTPVDPASQNTHLKTLDLSSYDQGFEANNHSGQSGHTISAVATAPEVMDEELPPWPAVDLLAKFRDLNIPVVALNIVPPEIPDNWVELQFAPGHRYTVQDADNRGFEQSGSLDKHGFARVKLPPTIDEVDFWFETDVETRPWYFDTPLQVVGGIRDAAQEVLDVTFELSTWLESLLPLGVILTGESAPNGYLGYVFPWEDNYADVQQQLEAQGNPLNLPKIAKPDTTVGAITNDVSQFLIGFIPSMRAVKFIKPTSKTGTVVKGMAVGAVVDATVFDPHEARLSDLLQQYPALRNPVTAYLQSDPTDSNAEGRFKLAIEGLILGAIAEQFLSALKVIKYARIRHLVQKAPVRFRYAFKLEGEKVLGVQSKNKVVATEFTGKYKGNPVTLKDVEVREINYTRRSRESLDELRKKFDSSVRKNYLKSIGSDPEKVKVMKAAGLSDAQIAKIAQGAVPKGYNVHHKIPIDDGGTNDFSNLVLIRNNSEHYTITNAQRDLTSEIPYGETAKIEFPVPPSFLYPLKGH